MKIIRWKNMLINLDRLVNTEYNTTQGQVHLHYDCGRSVRCSVLNTRELEELYELIKKATR